MGAVKKNFVLIVWFLFALSLILSMLALAGYGVHALLCHDADCAVCNLVHAAGGIFGSLKNLLLVLSLLAVSLCIKLFSGTPSRILPAFTPIAAKTKQTI